MRYDFHIKFGDGTERVESGRNFGEARDKALDQLPDDVKTVLVTVSTMGNVLHKRTMLESNYYARNGKGWRVCNLNEDVRRGHRLWQKRPKERT